MKLMSDCCQAEIIPAQPNQFTDQCSQCLKGIQYAYIGHSYESLEGFGVYQAFNGDYYFYWASCSRLTHLEEVVKHGLKYLTQVQTFVTTPASYYNKDQDMLTRNEILYVLNPWKDKVKNPEVLSKLY